MSTTTIQLTKLEFQISQILLNVSSKLRSTQNKQVTLRIAGGWVRDKLLGIESKDLDIALDTMTGYEFAKEVTNYLHEHGQASPNVAKIESNPDKSKHLETATMRLCGLFVDFVNLRTETYLEDSRVPEMDFGSPLEDALRRDITINALFYNIHTQTVEDFTEKGLYDLKHKIIRTPLPPFQTFIDDPLRVLRVIRFASRLDYHIYQDIFDAVKNKEIHDAFGSKISRERVGVEVEKMLKGPSPLRSLRLIKEFNFYDVVFTLPDRILPKHQHTAIETDIVDSIASSDYATQAVAIARAVNWLLSQQEFTRSIPDIIDIRSSDQLKMVYLAAAIFPHRCMTFMDARGKPQSVPKYIVLNSIKLSSLDADYSHGLVQFVDEIVEYLDSVFSGQRKETGLFIRKIAMKPIHSFWIYAFILAAAKEVAPFLEPSSEEIEGHGHAEIHRNTSHYNEDKVASVLRKYIDFFNFIHTENLDQVHSLKPLLDGKEICQLLRIKPGPNIGKILDSLIRWQLDHSNATKDDGRSWVLEVKDRLLNDEWDDNHDIHHDNVNKKTKV